MKNPAAVAFEAYRAATGEWRTSWAGLTPQERDAWWAVVRAIMELNSENPNEPS